MAESCVNPSLAAPMAFSYGLRPGLHQVEQAGSTVSVPEQLQNILRFALSGLRSATVRQA